MMKRKAGIMKINNQSPSAAPEKVKTRSAASKEAQEQQKLNGSPLATKDSAASKGSKQQQQQKKRALVQAASPESGAVNRPSVGGESSSSGGGGGGGGSGARTRRQLLKRERVEGTETVKKGDALKESGSVDSDPLQKPTKKSQQGHEDLSEQQPSSSVSPPLLGFDETDPQDTSERFPIRQQELVFASCSKRLRLQTTIPYTSTEQDDDDEFGAEGSSSSTASAVEDIEEEMDHAGGLVTAGSRARKSVKLEKVDTEETVVDDEGSTTIFMTEEDYQLHQQQQQQQDEQSAMDEYDTTGPGGGNEDMEDTDGGGATGAAYGGGNRLFRKKVKRKIARTSGSFGGGGGGGSSGEGSVVGSNVTMSSVKAKVQMLHEFPTLFLGLRRNRMFLVTSLAQSFDLNQRDIILALRKIKLNESSARLGMVFGVDANEVDVLVHTNVPKIADCLRNFILWPDDFTMKMNVPIKLRQHFNRIHLILNYLVVRLKSNAVRTLTALADVDATASYCQVEQCHKVKFLIASTLDGCVCFVSRAFAFQTDDEQVLSQSGFLTKFKTNTNLIAGKNFHHFEDRLANGHHTADHTNNNGAMGNHADDEADHFEDIVSEKISKSRTFKLKSYIENILENFQSYQMLHPQTCIDGRTFSLLDDIVVIVGALINLQKQEIE